MEDFDRDFLASHSHDAFIKDVLSNPVMAMAIFKEHFPPSVTSLMDWSSIRLEPGSFVKQSLHQAHSDLLFSVEMESSPCYLYMLFEHQTTVDEMMPFRLLNYIIEIMRSHVENHGLPLPPVLPMVFHQGPDRWNVSRCFEDMFDLAPAHAEALLPFLPKFSHALLDLSQFDPQKEGADRNLKAVLWLAKCARENLLTERLLGLILQALEDRELRRKGLLYGLHAKTTLDVETIARTIENNEPLKEELMSTAAALIAKGRAEGEAKGKAAGEARGLVIGKLMLLQEMMKLPVSGKEELSGLELAELENRYDELQRQYHAQFKRS